MEMRFSYPQMTSEQYIDTINLFNIDIDKENLKTFLPRIIVGAAYAVSMVLWGIFLISLFFKVVWEITAKGIFVIGMSLTLYVLWVFVSYFLLTHILKLVRPLLLRLFRARDAVESYSFSEYVERDESWKKAGDELAYYKMCDILKRSRIMDASAICDGTMCRVDIAFENSDVSSVFTFYLPYKASTVVDCVVVDFSRKCVLFPQEEGE